MRFIAGALIGIAGIWLGFALSGSLKKRAEVLAIIKNAFEEVRRRVVYLGQPLAQAFEASSPLMLDVAEAIMMGSFNPFTGCGAAAFLRYSDIEVLNEQVRRMYFMDISSKEGVCQSAVESVTDLSQTASDRAKQDGRMIKTLCACLGAAMAVLML